MASEWRRNNLIVIYNNKGDTKNYANYIGVKLMSHTMKLQEKTIEQRLKKKTQIMDNQFVLMSKM